MKKSLQERRKEHKMAVTSASRQSVNSNLNKIAREELDENVSRRTKDKNGLLNQSRYSHQPNHQNDTSVCDNGRNNRSMLEPILERPSAAFSAPSHEDTIFTRMLEVDQLEQQRIEIGYGHLTEVNNPKLASIAEYLNDRQFKVQFETSNDEQFDSNNLSGQKRSKQQSQGNGQINQVLLPKTRLRITPAVELDTLLRVICLPKKCTTSSNNNVKKGQTNNADKSSQILSFTCSEDAQFSFDVLSTLQESNNVQESKKSNYCCMVIPICCSNKRKNKTDRKEKIDKCMQLISSTLQSKNLVKSSKRQQLDSPSERESINKEGTIAVIDMPERAPDDSFDIDNILKKCSSPSNSDQSTLKQKIVPRTQTHIQTFVTKQAQICDEKVPEISHHTNPAVPPSTNLRTFRESNGAELKARNGIANDRNSAKPPSSLRERSERGKRKRATWDVDKSIDYYGSPLNLEK